MGDIKKDELKGNVFVTAHNTGELTDQVELGIDALEFDTYQRFLKVALEKRAQADRTGEHGGGTRSVAYLNEALENLEQILAH